MNGIKTSKNGRKIVALNSVNITVENKRWSSLKLKRLRRRNLIYS
jgi:hypothetical protein